MIEAIRVQLAAFWVALMLIYLLGDVLRIFAGDATPGEIDGVQATQVMWFGVSVLMLLPILMVMANVTLPHPLIRWMNIVLAGFFILFNLLGLPYKSAFDNFLIVVSFGVNALTIWYAWSWV
ncbi:MAG: hypothetical protein GYB68_05570 [Chloroflexi bacterium]|nr:hypothetical protein [Chloroflexota bacterium]